MDRLPWWHQPCAENFDALADDLADRLRGDGAVADGTTDDVRRLFALAKAQREALGRLETVVKLMAEMLTASGIIDPPALAERLDRVLEARR